MVPNLIKDLSGYLFCYSVLYHWTYYVPHRKLESTKKKKKKNSALGLARKFLVRLVCL